MKRSGGFDPVSIRRIGLSEVRRLAWTLSLLSWHGLRMIVRKLARSKRPVVGEELSRAFERLGSSYVKFGQIIASSPGLFPVDVSNEFQSLLDHVKPVPYEHIRRIITEELGAPPEELFAHFDPIPIASASIAQVHVATLAPGEEITLKVQRPGIQEQLQRDVRILLLLARALERVPRLRIIQPVNIVHNFATTLEQETDFLIEARSMERFKMNLRSFGNNDGVRVPSVLHGLTRSRVLTMERIYGQSFTDIAATADRSLDLVDVLKRMARAWIEAAFQHGFFHGDLHAGNLMVDADGKVVFLDFGIMGELDAEHMKILRKGLPKVFTENDFSEAARAFYQTDIGADPESVDRACADLGEMLAPILSRPLSELRFSDIFVSMIKVGDRHGVRLPIGMILVAKVLLYIDRYLKQMAPDWAMMNDTDLIWFLMDDVDNEVLDNGAPATAESLPEPI